MNPFALVFGFGLLALSLFYVAGPFRFHVLPKQPARRDGKLIQADRHQAVLLALRDLDFDYQAGKVGDEDYHTLRTELINEAAQLIQGQEQQDKEDDAIEALIASRRKARSLPHPTSKAKSVGPAEKVCQVCRASLQDGAQFCSKCGAPVGEAVCPKCRQAIYPGDLFCPSCGTAVKSAKQAVVAVGE
jgi:hypothetical protein